MASPTLIYCAAGGKRYSGIAVECGYKYGAQLPGTASYPVYFADQNWKKPDREGYMAALKIHKPHIASVLDWERQEQLSEVLSWAEDAAMYADTVMIVPKVQGGVSQLPRTIAGKPIILGYSVPTRYGGTQLHLAEFLGTSVHLLGGSPHAQMTLARYLNVCSVDGNMPALMSTRFSKFWQSGRWVSIIAADGKRWNDDADKTNAPYEAFRRSCINIASAWKKRYPGG